MQPSRPCYLFGLGPSHAPVKILHAAGPPGPTHRRRHPPPPHHGPAGRRRWASRGGAATSTATTTAARAALRCRRLRWPCSSSPSLSSPSHSSPRRRSPTRAPASPPPPSAGSSTATRRTAPAANWRAPRAARHSVFRHMDGLGRTIFGVQSLLATSMDAATLAVNFLIPVLPHSQSDT